MKNIAERRRMAGLTLSAALAAALPLTAAAECSREILAPVAPIGASIITNGNVVSGIYPDVLRSFAAKAGCQLVFSVVPRARLEVMFETGKADILVPAMRTPRRDQHGVFIPLIGHRATLISIASERAPLHSAQELLDRRELRVAVVRGFDYGTAYRLLLQELAKQGRLYYEVDSIAVARLMQAGAVDLTIMGPTILAGAIDRDPRVAGMLERLRIEPIPELPWGVSGAYVARQSLSAEDHAVLRDMLDKAAVSRGVYEGFQRYHRPDILAESVRPR